MIQMLALGKVSVNRLDSVVTRGCGLDCAAAAGRRNYTPAVSKAFSTTGPSNLYHAIALGTSPAVRRAFGVRHASTFKVVPLLIFFSIYTACLDS